ncbi:MAG: NADH-quinone oxidoreductase subunit H [Ignavibacteriae bacterium]|nr:NADH-quinone oxidoreductase subunit H [Ignavibacteriota bacterium]
MIKYIIILFLFVSPLFFIGLINKVKAVWAGRKGASVFQPYYDFFKLLRKGEVISKTTSFVFKISPAVNISAMFFALMLIPIPLAGSVISFPGDFVLFAYLLGISRFFMVIAALDTGSSFEGMGASREITFSTIVEPAFFVIIGSLALLTNQNSFLSIFEALAVSSGYTILVKILFVVSLFIMILVESCRVPVDDPGTHLELTMIHEVMVLDYSGPDLAYIMYSSALKMVIISSLAVNLLIPASLTAVPALFVFVLILVLISISIGIIESLIARSRISHVPQFIFLMTALSLIAFAVITFFLHGNH